MITKIIKSFDCVSLKSVDSLHYFDIYVSERYFGHIVLSEDRVNSCLLSEEYFNLGLKPNSPTVELVSFYPYGFQKREGCKGLGFSVFKDLVLPFADQKNASSIYCETPFQDMKYFLLRQGFMPLSYSYDHSDNVSERLIRTY